MTGPGAALTHPVPWPDAAGASAERAVPVAHAHAAAGLVAAAVAAAEVAAIAAACGGAEASAGAGAVEAVAAAAPQRTQPHCRCPYHWAQGSLALSRRVEAMVSCPRPRTHADSPRTGGPAHHLHHHHHHHHRHLYLARQAG
jgi:hypothetical protein